MAPVIRDPKLLRELMDDLERMADIWKQEAANSRRRLDREFCQARAAVLDDYARALERAFIQAPIAN